MIEIALGRDHNTSHVECYVVTDVADLAQLLAQNPSTKKGGAYITPASMRNERRRKENAKPGHLIGLDLDELKRDEDKAVLKALKRYEAVAWHTKRSTPDAPRMRVIVRSAKEISPNKYGQAHDALAAELSRRSGVDLKPDDSCRISAQPLFTPPEGTQPIVYRGQPFRANSELILDFKNTTPLKVGRRNKDLISIGGFLRARGHHEEQIFNALAAVNDGLDEPLPAKEVKTIARSAAKYDPDVDVDSPGIVLRTAAEIVSNPVPAHWLHRPYLEQNVLAVMAGDFCTGKSFIALDWCLCAAAGIPWYGDSREEVQAVPCVYISAEGRGLSKRIRAWVRHHFPDEPVEDVLKRLKFYAIEAAVNLSNPDRIKALSDAIDALPEHPALIVVDTLSKNSAGDLEESTSNMTPYLNGLNAQLRMRYRCTVLLVHHVGHMNKDRARGPISLVADTDASFIVERLSPTSVRLKTQRLKDSEVPAALALEQREVALNTKDADGVEETSLVLVPGTVVRVVPTGANQRKVYDALVKRARKEIVTYTKPELNA